MLPPPVQPAAPMNQQRHLIGRTILEISTGHLDDLSSLQEVVSCLFHQQAVPEIERLFDRLVGVDQVVRVDQVVVEVAVGDRQLLTTEFVSQLLMALQQTLSDLIQDATWSQRLIDQGVEERSAVTTRDRTEADGEVLLYFLQYGRLPWWVTALEWSDWMQRWVAIMSSATDWQQPLRSLLATHAVARQRVIEQFPEAFRQQLILQLQPAWTNWPTLLTQARYLMQELGLSPGLVQDLERQAWQLLLAEITPDSTLMQPFPVADWMRHWLTQFKQRVSAAESPEDIERRLGWEEPAAPIAQRLRELLEGAPWAEQPFWRAAIAQIFPPLVSSMSSMSSMSSTAPLTDGAVLLDFLQQGRLPSEGAAIAWSEWLARWAAMIQRDPNLRESLREVLATSPIGRQRLIEQFPEAFQQQLILQVQPTGTAPAPASPVPLNDGAVFLDFLQQGRLPSAQAAIAWPDWLFRWAVLLQSDPTLRASLRGLLATHVAVPQRLVEQFPEAFRQQLILQLQPAWTNWPTLLAQARYVMQELGLSPGLMQDLERQAWQLLLAEITPDTPPLAPLPVVAWMRHWLTQLVQQVRGETVPGPPRLWSEETAPPLDEQRFRTLFATLPAPEAALWQAAIAPVWAMLSAATDSEDGAEPASAALLATEFEPIGTGAELLTSAPLPPAPLLPASGEAEVALPAAEPSDREPADWAVLLNFLQQGQLSSAQATVDWSDWLSRWATVMQGETNWQERLRALLATQPPVRQRLVEQFPEPFRQQLILQMQPLWIAWAALLDQARQVMRSLNLDQAALRDLEVQAWELILAEIGSGRAALPTATWVRHWLAQVVRRLPVEGESGMAIDRREPDAPAIAPPSSQLRAILIATPLTEPDLWLTALDQVLLSVSTNPVNPLLDAAAPVSPPMETSEERPAPQAPDPAEVVARIAPIADRPPAPPRRSGNSPLSPEEEIAGLYITQAGLVLLHPFLRFYLEAVGLVTGETFRDEEAQQIAIYLLHYLATKQTDAPEYELVLPKLLCGWPLDEPVVRGLALPEAALAEGETLLQTAIDYWEVLKSTSPDGLREGFLQREGKLTRNEEGNWKLQVEQQTIDILLSRLPWGVSLVKLPWMADLLIVEWH